ncbi:hypothetical protein A0H81_08908 [Grifola frondosa]|uniref:Malonyl-CoA:ACP transacylase (MAT) domain-containing protein n=1 Tax=Grifola frondosa TaxID=5627 RepID=A0A1C7M7Y5_GRIFR|nr:hypothetical protein A0H81_08908 [Grifola frondosa]
MYARRDAGMADDQVVPAALAALIEGAPHDALTLTDVAYSSAARRKLFWHCVVVTGCSTMEPLGNLHNAQIAEVMPQKGREQGKALFVFSGQGGQYVGMAAELGGEVDVRARRRFRHSRLFQIMVFVLEHALASLCGA